MKKLLYAAIAAIGLLLSPACSNEDELSNDNEALISFNVGVENGMQTKATIADGSTATVLKVRVFENAATPGTIQELAAFQQDFRNFTGSQDNIQFSLLKGKKYYFLFWAEAATSPYTIETNGTITVSYEGAKCNDENRDAFVGVYECVAQTTINENVTLKRPFAQLNFLTTEQDIKAAAAGKIVTNPTAGLQTQVVINKAADKLNPFTGVISGEVSNITFDYAAAPFSIRRSGTGFTANDYTVTATNGTINVGSKDRHFLATNYFLTNQVADVEATMTVKDADYSGLTVPSIPVNKNYRTNIYGDLLTKPGQFTVTINPVFDDTENQEHIVSITKEVSNYTEFAAALANGSVDKIVLTGDIDLSSFTTEPFLLSINRSITIEGGTNSSTTLGKYGFLNNDGYGGIGVTGNNTITFKNIDFMNGSGTNGAVYAASFSGTLIVEDCNIWGALNTDENGFLNHAININGVSNDATIKINNNMFYGRGQTTLRAVTPDGGDPAQGQFIIIQGNAEGCTATVQVTNNTFSDPNKKMGDGGSVFPMIESANIKLKAAVDPTGTIITLKNLTAAKTTVGGNKNKEGDAVSTILANRISFSFSDQSSLTEDAFFSYFTGDIKTVAEHIGN